MLVSPFTRKTSIRMVSESASKYSICLPTEDNEITSPIISPIQEIQHDRNNSECSLGSFMRNAFSSELDISLLEQTDFSFSLSPTPEAKANEPSMHPLKSYTPPMDIQQSMQNASMEIKTRNHEEYADQPGDNALKVPIPTPRRSSVISLIMPREASSSASGTISKAPVASKSDNTNKRLLKLANGKTVSSLQSLPRKQAIPKIQTEIAEPTFIRSRAISMNTRAAGNVDSLCNSFIELGSDLIGLNPKRIKHFKSESDLLKLKDTLRPTESKSDYDMSERTSDASPDAGNDLRTSTLHVPSKKISILSAETVRRPSNTVFEDDGLISLLR